MEHLNQDVTRKLRVEEMESDDREARKKVAMDMRSKEQGSVAKRELARRDFELAYETKAFSEPDPQQVETAYQHRLADWESVRHMIDWGLYRQALLQEVFCGTSEYEEGTTAEKLANLRFLEEREFTESRPEREAA